MLISLRFLAKKAGCRAMKIIREKVYKLVIGILLIGVPLIALEPGKRFQKKPRLVAVEEIDGEYFPESISGFMKDFGGREIPREPLVFRGAAKNWPSKKWTPEWLAENYGDEKVNPNLNWNNGQMSSEDFNFKVDQYYRLADHIKDIRNNEKHAGYLLESYCDGMSEEWKEKQYCNQTEITYKNEKYLINGDGDIDDEVKNVCSDSLLIRHSELMSDVKLPRLDVDDYFQTFTLYIGPGNTRSKFHNHSPVFLAQIYGTKKVYLVSPDYENHLCCKYNDEDECISDVNPQNPDLEACPSFGSVEMQEIVLNAGDVIYIPPYWYHYIVATDTSISINMLYDKFSDN